MPKPRPGLVDRPYLYQRYLQYRIPVVDPPPPFVRHPNLEEQMRQRNQNAGISLEPNVLPRFNLFFNRDLLLSEQLRRVQAEEERLELEGTSAEPDTPDDPCDTNPMATHCTEQGLRQ